MLREKVTFPANTPIELVMEFDDGKLLDGRFGESYQYALAGDRIAFVEPLVDAKRKALGIRAGEPFTVTRITAGRETKNWDVQRVGAEAPRAIHQPIHQAPAAATPPTKVQTATETVVQQNGRSHSNGNAYAEPASLVVPLLNSLLVSTGKNAIDAVLAVEAYAREKGMGDFQFGPENIQKVWLSAFIAHQGKRSS